MVEKDVSVEIPALGVMAVKAAVTAHDTAQGIYVFDLFDAGGNLVAKSRYIAVDNAPFELTEEEQASFVSVVEEVDV
jgi:hypothetical protein